MTTNSLAVRLLLGAAIWSIAALAIGGLVLSAVFRDRVEQSFDARLDALLRSLIAASEANSDGTLQLIRQLGEPRFEQPYSGWYWQISGAIKPAIRSRSLWDQTLPEGTAGGSNFDHLNVDGPDQQQLRMVLRRLNLPGVEGPVVFVLAADLSDIEADVAAFNTTLIWALGLLGAGLVAAVLIQVLFGLRPLRRIRAGLTAVRTGEAELLDDDFPSEIKPLAIEINALIEENAAVVERARTHVGNLAHALKTPLSVLTNASGREHSPLGALVDRQSAIMRRQVDHYLARGRTAAAGRVLGARTLIAPVLDDMHRTLLRIHADRDLDIAIDCGEALAFRGERQDLEEMLGNLFDNACKWSAGRIRIRARAAGEQAIIVIEDDGPGIAAEQREMMLKRGARLDEQVPGSGLGLAIVRDISRLYGGDVGLDQSPLGGLKAELTLPATSASSSNMNLR